MDVKCPCCGYLYENLPDSCMGHESECHKCGMAFTMSKYDCEPKKILDGPGPLGYPLKIQRSL
jgi:hypothetical protein